jgi:hypothetical protein
LLGPSLFPNVERRRMGRCIRGGTTRRSKIQTDQHSRVEPDHPPAKSNHLLLLLRVYGRLSNGGRSGNSASLVFPRLSFVCPSRVSHLLYMLILLLPINYQGLTYNIRPIFFPRPSLSLAVSRPIHLRVPCFLT